MLISMAGCQLFLGEAGNFKAVAGNIPKLQSDGSRPKRAQRNGPSGASSKHGSAGPQDMQLLNEGHQDVPSL